MQMKGIQVPWPRLWAGGKKRIEPTDKGKFDIRGQLYTPLELRNFVLVYVDNNKDDKNDADDFMDLLVKSSQKFKIRLEKEGYCKVKGGNKLNDWLGCIDDDIKEYGSGPMYIFFMQKRHSHLYTGIKKYFNC